MTRGEEVQAKLQRLREWMDREKVGPVVMSTQANFAWVTAGGDNHVLIATDAGICRVVVTDEGQYLLTNNIEAVRLADEELDDLPFEIVYDNWHEQDDLGRLESLAAGKIVTDTDWPAGAENRADDISRLQWALLPSEQERYRQVGVVCSRALTEAAREIEPGMSEHEMGALLAGKVMAAGIMPVVVLIAVDERIYKYRHPIPTDKRLEKQAMLVVCGRGSGLIVSATRLVYFGDIPAELQDKHRAVCTVDTCLNLETRPGAAVKDIFRQAVDTYAETGYAEEWRLHHQGGGTGYGARTFKGGLDSVEVVLEGQAFAWNPSIAGTKSEDTIIAHSGGPEFLSAAVDWPMLAVEWQGQKIERPDILQR